MFNFLHVIAQPYDLTDRDSVRQLLSSQKQQMRQLDTALGDALADFHDPDEDLVIDEKPIKLRLSLGTAAMGETGPRKPLAPGAKSPPKRPLKTVIRPVTAGARSKASEDMNMTKVHQDDDYVYPSLELSDDEMEVGPSVILAKDDAWTPKVKVKKKNISLFSRVSLGLFTFSNVWRKEKNESSIRVTTFGIRLENSHEINGFSVWKTQSMTCIVKRNPAC